MDKPRATVADLVAMAQIPVTGTAVALNNRVVPRKAWGETWLSDGDKVTVITAVCGG
ncbi:MAG: sulfur carrier protein ThiS [Muribaculaceae bacterium]|nr:sulfur carrier protein ThiS [Muribaculaceae bacterium]